MQITREVKNWSIERLHKSRAKLSFPEYQRQPNLWPDEKKGLLIDSILMNIDIPKLYFNCAGKDSYEVIDGQQRLWAIWEFLDDGFRFPFAKKGEDVEPTLFSELPKAHRDAISKFEFQVTELENVDENYLRQLFLRLQLGLLLNTGEKLHAETGAMKTFVFDRMVKSQFVAKVGVGGRRFVKETLCAQICVNSFYRKKSGSFARTRYEDLLAFFREYGHPVGKDAAFFQERTVAILGCLEAMFAAFGSHTPSLKNRSYVLSIYLFFEEMLESGNFDAKERKRFVDFTLQLWSRLREEVGAGIDRKNRKLYELETLVSSAPGERYQIERRHAKLREFYDYYVDKGRILGDAK